MQDFDRESRLDSLWNDDFPWGVEQPAATKSRRPVGLPRQIQEELGLVTFEVTELGSETTKKEIW